MSKNMTKGQPGKLLISFALPMLAGNLIQQLYNVADTIIVGRFVNKQALAAVGACFALMVFITSAIIGLALGASVLFAKLYGAHRYEELSSVVFYSSVAILLFTLVLSLVLIPLVRPIVLLYRMPAETVEYAVDYLTFIFAGLVFSALYNLAACLLRAVGDSKSPLYFLVLACLVNIGLDLTLVVGLGMEVRGAAIATLIAQALAGILCVGYAFRRLDFLSLKRGSLHFYRPLMWQAAKYALLTAVQQSVMNFGVLLVQGLVNSFGTVLMAAFAAGVKIDAFAYMPLQDFGNALATYTAQNIGAKKPERVRMGFFAAAKISVCFSLGVSLLVVLFAPQLVGLFVRAGDTAIVVLGTEYLRVEGVFYALIGLLFLFYGFYRGLGRAGMSIILTVVSLGTRVLLAYTLAPTAFGYRAIFIAIPIGWLLADIVGAIGLRGVFHPQKSG